MGIKICPDCGAAVNGTSCPKCGRNMELGITSKSSTNENGNASGNAPSFGGQRKGNQELLKKFGLSSKPSAVSTALANDSPAEQTQASPKEPTYAEKKQMLNDVLNEPVEEELPSLATSDNSPKGPRIKKPELKKKKKTSIANSFFSQGYEDEASPEESYVKIIQDDTYNRSNEMDGFIDDPPEEEPQTSSSKPQKRSRSANSSASAVTNSAKKVGTTIVNKATNAAAKRLITEDKTLDKRHKVYIIEQEELADPDDPTYDGYYENILPIDYNGSDDTNSQANGKKLTLNDETKQTLLILLGLVIALFVIIIFYM